MTNYETGSINLSALLKMTGWRVECSEYHHEIVTADMAYTTDIFTRAWYRAYGFEDYSQVENVAFAFSLSKDGCTGVANIKGMKADELAMVDGIILGIMSALEIRYEAQNGSGEVKA